MQGAYFRAYVLLKDRGDIEPAVQLLAELNDRLLHDNTAGGFLQARTARMYANALTRYGDSRGRVMTLELLEKLEGVEAEAGEDEELERLLSDLCGDLSLVGAHDEAVAVAKRISMRPVAPKVRAYRLGNLAAWLLQRAVSHRAGGDRAGALEDLDVADDLISEAMAEYRGLTSRFEMESRLRVREARAIEHSIDIERSAVAEIDVRPAIAGFQALLRESLPLPREETYLQMGYRIGRLGVGHLRSARRSKRSAAPQLIERARFYLEHAWISAGNARIQPWLALDLHEALLADEDQSAAAHFAQEATERLAVQCGTDYVVTAVLQEAAIVGRQCAQPITTESRGFA